MVTRPDRLIPHFFRLICLIGLIVVSSLYLDRPRSTLALNKTTNWNFATDASGWSSTNDNGTNVCGNTGSSTADNAMATLAYSGNVGGQTAFQAVTANTSNTAARGMIHQTVTAPGSGSVKVAGRFSYYASSSYWNSTATSWIRLDLYDSSNSTYVANLGCVSFNANQSWTTTSFAETTVTGGTTYTLRATLRGLTRDHAKFYSAITLAVDNITLNFAPVGLQAANVTASPDLQLNWTASQAGSGADGLHATTPYKIYRDTASPVSTYLGVGSTNAYTDTTTVGNTTYHYAVTDLDTSSAESPKSAEASRLTLPDTPTNPVFTNVLSTSLRVGWTAPTGGAAGYQIERCQGSACSDFSQIAAGITDLYYDDSGLSASTLYRYRLRGSNASGDGAYSGIGEQSTPASEIYSVTLSPEGTIEYGYVGQGSGKTTLDLGKTQTAANTGNTAAKLNIKTSAATGGIGWTLGSTPGTNIFVHEFSTNGGGSWTLFADDINYQTLAASVGVGATALFDLRVTIPTSSDIQQKSIVVTVQATAP